MALYVANISSLYFNYLPANACRVVPPIWQAATPVLAVANVCCGGKVPKIHDFFQLDKEVFQPLFSSSTMLHSS